MTSTKTAKLVLLILFGLSLFIRLYQLGKIPSTLNRDEAAVAYNAYLLRETGQDEWGRSWPLALQSFGDYKLPGYPLALIPLFDLFGLHDWVVRLPAAVAGSLLVIVSYFFARALKFNRGWALLAAGMTATTPVLFFFSHMGFEAMLGLALFWSAITLLISSSCRAHDIQALLILLLAVFTYNTPLLLLPVILVFLVGWRLVQHQRWLFTAVGLVVIGLIGGTQLLTVASQKSAITIFEDEAIWTASVDYYQQFSGVWQQVFGNKYVFYVGQIGQRYWQTLQPQFLLEAAGGHPWHSVPGSGHLLVITYGLFIVGLLTHLVELVVALVRRKVTRKVKLHGLLMLLLWGSLLPAVVTVDAPHATRSLFFFALTSIYAVVGLQQITGWVRDWRPIKQRLQKLVVGVVIGALVLGFGRYLYQYLWVYPSQQKTFRPGFAEVIAQVERQYPDQKVAVVDGGGYQYILLAWYLKLPPAQFYSSVVRQLPDRIGFRYGEQLDRYHFIADAEDRQREKVLVYWDGSQWSVEEF